MLSICQWIHQTPVSVAIRESIWVYPILDVLHCVGILLVAGTIVVVDLRLLGFGMRRAPDIERGRPSPALDSVAASPSCSSPDRFSRGRSR